MPEFAARLKELRDARGWTNTQLSEASGVPLGTVNRLLSGQTENPMAQNIVDLVSAIGGSVDYVMGLTTNDKEEDQMGQEKILELCDKMLAQKDDIIKHKDAVIDEKNKWIKTLFICVIVLVSIFIGIALFDIFNPNVGYVRY